MHSSDNRSSISFVSFRRPILGIRNDQIHSMGGAIHDSGSQEVESFHQHIFTQFKNLSSISPDEFLSISWIQRLLDAFTSCQEEFKVVLSNNKTQLSKPPTDKLITEFFDRAIKALDICNASRDGIEKIRLWLKHLDIVTTTLDAQQRMSGEGQFRRARKALMDLALVMLDEKDNGGIFSNRNRSFGRHKGKDNRHRSSGHSRSLSWSVSHSWSASKQLQSIASNLNLPRGNELTATNGLAMLVYAMSFVLLFVLWALVAAIPYQDRSAQFPFTIPRQFSWSGPFFLLHSRIMDEAKKREHRNSTGLLKEICQIEKCVNHITDLVESAQFPMMEEQKEEVKECVRELLLVCEACKNGLDPLERQLREVFRKIMSCRIEGLEFLGNTTQS